MSSSGNRRYLREHPELRSITTWFISEVICIQPPDILQFAASFFRSRVMQDYVAQSLGHENKDTHVAALRAAALNVTSSSTEPSGDEADIEAQHRDRRSTCGSSSSSISGAYRRLISLSEKLGEARRCGNFSDNIASDGSSLPEELSSETLANDVKEILSNTDGLHEFMSTFPETLSSRRAAYLLQGLANTFKPTLPHNTATDVDGVPSASVPPVTLATLLPLVNNKLWGSTQDSENQTGNTPTYEVRIPGRPGSNLNSTIEVSHVFRQLPDGPRPGLFVGDYDAEMPGELQKTTTTPNPLVTESIAFHLPTSQPDQELDTDECTPTPFAEYTVVASKFFMSSLFLNYDKLKEIESAPLDSSLFTSPGVLVQHSISHLLSCPLLVPITLHVRSLLTSCLFISRGGLLQWHVLLGFSNHEFKPISIESALDSSMLASTTFKASLEQSLTQSAVKSNVQTEEQAMGAPSPLPTISASGRLRFSDMLSRMEMSCSPTATFNDQPNNEENSHKESIIFTTESNPPLALSPRQQRCTNLLYREISPDLLTFFRSIAPHISGIGIEEYDYGILDVCTFLPSTYFCCANLEIEGKSNLGVESAPFKRVALDASEVYVGKLCSSLPLRYLFSVNSIFPGLGYGHFRLFKYLPVIVRGRYPHSEPSNICIVFTSILPTTHCDNTIPGRSVVANLKRKGSVVSASSYCEFYALPPSARLLEGINTEVYRMLEKAEIEVSAVRYVLLSSTTSYGHGTLVSEDTGNFLSNSWMDTYIFPNRTTPNYTAQNILCFHEFMNIAYKSPEYAELLQKPYDYEDPKSVDVSAAVFFSLWDVAEEGHVGAVPVRDFTGPVGSSALSRPYKHLLHTKTITTHSYMSYISQLQPLQKFVQRDVMARFPLVVDKLLYRDLLSCRVLPWLGPVEYVSFLAKTIHTPLFCYLAHKLRDCTCYYLPIISSHRRSLLVTMTSEAKETDSLDIIAGLTTDMISRLNNRMTDQRLHPSTTIDLVACFSARVLAGGTPSYEPNDVHHDSMNCNKSCSTTAVKSRIYQTRSVVYPDNTVSSFLATFPSLFSTDAQLYLTRLTLRQLFDALCCTYSLVFNGGQRSVHIVCDSLPYLTNVGLYYDVSKDGNAESFLFNLEKLSYDLVSQLKYSVAKDTIVSKVEENYALFEKSRILDLVHKHRLTSEEMEREVLLLTDRYMLNSPIGIARKLSLDAPGWHWSPMVVPLRARHYNQIEEKYEFDDTKEPINLHLTAGHALVGRYYPGLDPEKGIYAMEDHMRRAIYSVPFPIVSSSGAAGIASSGAWRHLLELIH